MLTISKPLSAGQAQTYHRKEFTAKEQNYWSQRGVIAGEWQGRLAVQFGLAGTCLLYTSCAGGSGVILLSIPWWSKIGASHRKNCDTPPLKGYTNVNARLQTSTLLH